MTTHRSRRHARLMPNPRSGRASLVRTALVAAVAVWLALTGCGGRSADDALGEARAKTLAARHLVTTYPGGRQLLFGPELTVIRRRGRVLAWVQTDEELTRNTTKPCYDRHTEFDRDDLADQREGVMPPDVDGVEWTKRGGIRLLSGRERHMDFADTEFEARVDAVGRLATARFRAAEFGVLPAGRWTITRYRYPSAEEFARFAGRPPEPLCR